MLPAAVRLLSSRETWAGRELPWLLAQRSVIARLDNPNGGKPAANAAVSDSKPLTSLPPVAIAGAPDRGRVHRFQTSDRQRE